VKRVAHLFELLAAAAFFPVARLGRLVGWHSRRILIVGWWGSETVGDVAILGRLFAECDELAPDAKLTLASFDCEVSRRSLAELGRPDVELLPVGAASGWAAVACRALVYGGGPLMESPSMLPWAVRARLARWAGARVMLYACGIGPVRSARTAGAVRTLVRAATHVVFRDRSSYDWDRDLSIERRAVVSFDPAFDYATRMRSPNAERRRDRLALALRLPTTGYLGRLDAGRAGEAFLDVVAEALNTLAKERALELVGCTMHTGFAESDDHGVYERLRERLTAPGLLTVARSRHSVADVVRVLETSQAALTVRFHGMIFALATGTPFVAIDYARPSGKVSAAAAMVGRSASVVGWDELTADDLARRLREMLECTRPPPPVNIDDARQARMAVLREAIGSPSG
jgi:polysaccharide pyruvyl transferase WcaK-like protein